MIIKKLEEMKVGNEINNKITYHQEGDYLIPDIKLPEENPKYKNKTIGKYGQLRLNYLKEYKKGLYQQLLIENKLFEHLIDTNEEAKSRIRLITNQIARHKSYLSQHLKTGQVSNKKRKILPGKQKFGLQKVQNI